MRRDVHQVRLSTRERQILEAVARRKGIGWSTWLRESALDASVEELEQEHPDLRSSSEEDQREPVRA